MKKPIYIITKLFTGGLLKGIRNVEESSFRMEPGFTCNKPAGGSSPYKIVSCERAK